MLIANNQQSTIKYRQLLKCSEPLVDFGDGELDLLLADRMLGCFSLLLEVGLCKAERLDFADLLRINLRATAAAAPPLGLPLFDLLLNPRFCVDEALMVGSLCAMVSVIDSGAGEGPKSLFLTSRAQVPEKFGLVCAIAGVATKTSSARNVKSLRSR